MKNRKLKSRFINLAEHLAIQNGIVSRTMDSLVEHVSKSGNVEGRSDWDEIRKTREQFEPSTEVEDSRRDVPAPKMKRALDQAGRQITEASPNPSLDRALSTGPLARNARE